MCIIFEQKFVNIQQIVCGFKKITDFFYCKNSENYSQSLKEFFVGFDDRYKRYKMVLLLVKIRGDIVKSIVEKIFYGNLRPNDDINKYAEKEVQEMLGAEKKLVEALSEEQRELYEELSIQQSICGGLENLEAFRRGLGIGIELMTELMNRADNNE